MQDETAPLKIIRDRFPLLLGDEDLVPTDDFFAAYNDVADYVVKDARAGQIPFMAVFRRRRLSLRSGLVAALLLPPCAQAQFDSSQVPTDVRAFHPLEISQGCWQVKLHTSSVISVDPNYFQDNPREGTSAQ